MHFGEKFLTNSLNYSEQTQQIKPKYSQTKNFKNHAEFLFSAVEKQPN